mmetsp:Transcript_117783/g.380100  ORF Transcript_117783/g.380100 Transcript_117783/m.380100 type:complete len:221 (+) Transcript_117783:311-973(+)
MRPSKTNGMESSPELSTADSASFESVTGKMSSPTRMRASPSSSGARRPPEPSQGTDWLSRTLRASCPERGTWKARRPVSVPLSAGTVHHTQLSSALAMLPGSPSCSGCFLPASVRLVWPDTPTGAISTQSNWLRAKNAGMALRRRRQRMTLRTVQSTRHCCSPQQCTHLSACGSSSILSPPQQLPLPPIATAAATSCNTSAPHPSPGPGGPLQQGRAQDP